MVATENKIGRTIEWLTNNDAMRGQVGEHALLERVSRLFWASSLLDAYNDMLEGACALADGYAAWLLTQAETNEALQPTMAWGADTHDWRSLVALGQGLAGSVAQQRQAAFVALTPDNVAQESPYSDAARAKYAIAVPLLRSDRTLMGVVQVDSDHPFSERRRSELLYFLQLAMVAIERVGMVEDMSAGVVSMSVIGTLYSVLNAEAQLSVLEQEVADYAAKQVEGDLCLLAIVEDSEPHSKGLRRTRRWRVGGLSHDAEERQAEMTHILGEHAHGQVNEEQLARALVQNKVRVNDLQIKPLENMRRQLGTIYAVRLEGSPRFNEREKAAFAYYTSAAAIALDNATLLADNRARLEQILELKELNENIIRQMGSGVITCDPDGKLMMLNHAAEQLLSWSSEQAVGKLAVDVLGLDGYERLVCINLLHNKTSGRHEIHLHSSDGREIVVELSATPLTDTKSNFNGMIVLINDLTQAREQEAERKRVERLDAIANMAAHVAHEMRNPLGIINLLAQNLNIMLDQAGDDHRAEREDSLRRLQKQVARLSSMLNEILNFSRPPQLHFAPTHLPQMIRQSLLNHSEVLHKNHIKVTESYGPDLPPLMMDMARIEAVLDNLVRNAAQAMSDGGELDIAACCISQPEQHGGAETLIEVTVSDTGVGISDDVLPHIFEPFYTNKAQGTGLGLAIVRRFVEEHNGSVIVSSKVQQGTTFTLHFRVKTFAADE